MVRTSVAPVGAPILALWLSTVASCTTETPAGTPADGAASASQAADGPAQAAGDRRSIAVRCAMDDALDPAVRQQVVARGSALLAALREGRHDALWEALHPQAQRPEDRQAFLDTVATLQARLAESPVAPPTPETVAVGEVKGGVNDVARLVCRPGEQTDGPPALTVLVNAGDEDVAYVSLVVPGPVFEHVAVLELRKREQWRLLGLQVHPSRFRNMSAVDWVTLAGTLRRAQKLVPAYAALAMAGAMASRGPSVTTPLSTAIEQDLQTLGEHPLFVAQTKTWTVDGRDFALHGLSLAATQSDVSLVVKYVNARGLVEEFVGRDADKLMDYVRTEYPELSGIVDAVIFEAYAKSPGTGGETVDAFRVARFF